MNKFTFRDNDQTCCGRGRLFPYNLTKYRSFFELNLFSQTLQPQYNTVIFFIHAPSERALQLTALCLRYNPANYTTWWYRRRCLSALSGMDRDDGGVYDFKRIVEDLELASAIGGSNPKNYQIWYHRRSLLELSFEKLKKSSIGGRGSKRGQGQEKLEGDGFGKDIDSAIDRMQLARDELEYIANVLKEDAKNYHVSSNSSTE